MHLLHHCKILLIAWIPIILELIEEFGNHKAQNIGKGKEKEKEAFHYQDTSNNDINTNRKQLQVYLESRNIYILKGNIVIGFKNNVLMVFYLFDHTNYVNLHPCLVALHVGWCTGAAGWFGGLELDHNCTWMEVM
jgi:hypothetical protein